MRLAWTLGLAVLAAIAGLPPLVNAQQPAEGPQPPQPPQLNFSVGVVHDDNVTRGGGAGEKLADQFVNLNVSKSHVVPLTDNTRFIALGFLGADIYREYSGLSRVFLGLSGEYQYRPTAEFEAPTLALFARVSHDGYEAGRRRDGNRFTVGASIRKPLTDKIEVFGAYSYLERSAVSTVFSSREHSLRANVDFLYSSKETIYATGEVRRGHAVSTGLPSLANVNIADAIISDDAFTGTPRFAYRTEARTWLATLGYNYAIDEKNAFDISWRQVKSTPVLQPTFAGAQHISYTVNQFSLTYLFRY